MRQPAPAQGDSCTLSACTSTSNSSPPPPPPPTSTVPVYTPPPSSPPPSTPPPRTAPAPVRPAGVTHLSAHRGATGVELTWRLPASGVVGVVVRRSIAGSCPKTTDQGIAIGGTRTRRSQRDAGVHQSARYCYSVFVLGRAGLRSPRATVDRVVIPDRTPPGPVSALTVHADRGTVQLRWQAATGSPARYDVQRMNGGACPTGPSDGTRVATTTSTGYTDTVAPGHHYCYAVFPVDHSGNVQQSSPSASVTVAAAHRSAPAPPPATTTSFAGFRSWRVILAALVSALVFAIVILAGVRLLHPPRTAQPAVSGARLALESGGLRAMVIPALLVVLTLVLVGVAVAVAL